MLPRNAGGRGRRVGSDDGPDLAVRQADHDRGAVSAQASILVARSAGGKLGAALGQSIVVENRVGANGTIGSNAVARAAPDGYTVLAATAGTHVTAVHLMKNLPYDPLKDFTPIVSSPWSR